MTEVKTYRLLLVDDNPVNLELLKEVVANHLPECLTTLATSGAQALELAQHQHFDGAFVDMQMPGMDGIEVCRRLKGAELTADIPVVLMTAHQSTAELRAAGLDAGAFDFISQPIRNVELVARIKVLLRIRNVEERLQQSNQGLRQQVNQKTAALRWMTGLISASGGGGQYLDAGELDQLEMLLHDDGKLSFAGTGGKVFDTFPGSVRKILISLSLLDEIPVQLAEKLTGSGSIRDVLDYLERQNFFVSYRPEKDCYLLKGPLKNHLNSLVELELGAEEVRDLYLTAADWWLEHQSPMLSVELLMCAGDWRAAERIMQQVAPLSYGSGKLSGLLNHGEEILRQDRELVPWLYAAHAVVLLDRNPQQGLRQLQSVARVFAGRDDGPGMLFCASQQLKAHFVVDGDLRRQAELLEVIEELWRKIGSACDPHLRTQTALFAALAHLELGTGQQQASLFLEASASTGAMEGCLEYQAWSSIVRSFECFVAGRWRSCFRELEQFWTLECQTDFSSFVLLAGNLVRAMLLEVYADEPGLGELWARIRSKVPEETLHQTVLPFMRQIQSAQLEVSRGAWRRASDLLSELPATVQLSDHLKCLMLEQQAQTLALAGQSTAALHAARESVRLRNAVGGYFLTRNALLMASVYFSLGATHDCSEQLDILLSDRNARDDQVLLRLGQWLASRVNDRGDGEAGIVLEGLFGDLSHLQLTHIPFWFPPVHRQLMFDAAAMRCQGALLLQLSHHHLDGCLAGDNAVVPLLEVRVLGEFSIAIPGGEILRKKDLSISFRQLLAMLIAAPHQQLSQDKIQAQLWPDSTAERSRSKFDTLLMRLRKTLEGYLAGRDVKSYLFLQKGVLCLDCCRIDAIEFESLARLGIKHVRRMELWQADLVFRRAFRLWHGELNLGVSLDEKSDFFRQDLLLLYLDAAQRWTELLLKARRYETAVDMSRQALKYEPTHDHLIRLNRSACLALGLHGQASQLLKDYAEALRLDGHDAEEISDILRSIESGVSP